MKPESVMKEHPHIVDGEFQSDKYPTCPRGKVPLSVKDKDAQDLLWTYAQRHRKVDPQFSNDLELALRSAGFIPELHHLKTCGTMFRGCDPACPYDAVHGEKKGEHDG